MSDDRVDEAAARRLRAEERAEELHALRERLEHGDPLTVADVELADRRMDEAARRAGHAHERAASAHHRAADRHREAAELAERAGQAELAEHHRHAAAFDDSSAGVDEDEAAKAAKHQQGHSRDSA